MSGSCWGTSGTHTTGRGTGGSTGSDRSRGGGGRPRCSSDCSRTVTPPTRRSPGRDAGRGRRNSPSSGSRGFGDGSSTSFSLEGYS